MKKHIFNCLFLLLTTFTNCIASSVVKTKLVLAKKDSIKIITDTIKKIQLEELSLNSVRAEHKLPITETILQKSDIEQNYTGQEMPAVLSKTPSVTWYSDGGHYTGYSYLRLRGIDQTRINFTLNGVPLNEPEDQGAYFSNYPDFLNSVRSLQIQRGVGISTNGTASFGGSVNLESPSLTDSSYVELNSSYGSYATYRLSPEFNTGLLKNNWSFYGRYSNVGSNGFRENSGNKGQSFFFSGGKVSKHGILKFTGFTGTSKNEMSYLAVADTALKNNYRANPLSKEENDEFRQSIAMLQYIVPINNHSLLTSTFYYNYLEGGYSILFPPDLYKFSVKSNFYGGIINYQYKKKNLRINTGLHANDYIRYHYASIEPNANTLLYTNSGHKNEIATFLKLTYDIKKITFFIDLQHRLAQFNYQADINSPIMLPSIQWQFFNPKAGISCLVSNKHNVYVSIGKTSREPTRNDMFAGYDNIDSLNYLEIVALYSVKPESVIDIEAGVKLTYQQLKLDINFYNMQFKNEIAAIGQLSYIGLPLRKNVESSYRRGLELSMTLQPSKKFRFITQANLSSNRIKRYVIDYDSTTYTNVQPLLTPPVIIDQSINYTFTKWLSADLNGRYLAESFLDNSNNLTVPASFVVNASLQFTFMKYHSINFMVNNISNQRYYTSGYVQNAQPYYFAMATRNYFVTLKLRF